jgi:hypothetical protein
MNGHTVKRVDRFLRTICDSLSFGTLAMFIRYFNRASPVTLTVRGFGLEAMIVWGDCY